MSNRAQINQQAARDDVPAPTVEQDYVLAHIMAAEFNAIAYTAECLVR